MHLKHPSFFKRRPFQQKRICLPGTRILSERVLTIFALSLGKDSPEQTVLTQRLIMKYFLWYSLLSVDSRRAFCQFLVKECAQVLSDC